MRLKEVLREIKLRGFAESYQIYKAIRSSERNDGVSKSLISYFNGSARRAKKELMEIFDELEGITSEAELQKTVRKIQSLLNQISNALSRNDRRAIDAYIKERETKKYKRELQRQYIKEILPRVYAENSKKSIEDKVLFLQPRRGLNQSFQFLYSRLDSEYDYRLKLYELHRGEVSSSFYFHNAEVFVRDMATAKAIFVHESNNLLGHLSIRSETKVIQLWHGCGVYKKIGLSTIGQKKFKSAKTHNEYPEYNNYSAVTIASPELSWVFEEFMGIDKESDIIKPIGVSRTDVFFNQEYKEKCYQKLYRAIPAAKDKKVILYAPTYRGLGRKRTSPDALNVSQFAEELGNEYILIFKHHQTVIEVPEIPEEYEDAFAYDMTRGKGMDISELMTVADVCVSDYSSLTFEYSLFERPMIFFVFDLEEYIDERGLYYNFDDITPGPQCRTNEEMIDYIKNIDTRFNKQEVINFKNKFMSSCDGHATERIIDLIEGRE